MPFLAQNCAGGTTNNGLPGPQPIPEALPGLINSRDWDPEPWVIRPVGEVPTWSDDRTYNGHWTEPPALEGEHVCHPEYFPTGEPYPPTLPPADYDRFGIPGCCRDPIPTEGGVEVGGENPPSPPEYREATGGAEVGGENPPSPPQSRAAFGGVEVGGTNPPRPTHSRAAFGGVEVGGANPPRPTHSRAAFGGVEVGGTSPGWPTHSRAAFGGVEVGGDNPPMLMHIRSAGGGVEVGGTTQGTVVLPCCGSVLAAHPDLNLHVLDGPLAGNYTMVWTVGVTIPGVGVRNVWRFSEMGNAVNVWCEADTFPGTWRLYYNLPSTPFGSGLANATSAQCDPFLVHFPATVFTTGSDLTID